MAPEGLDEVIGRFETHIGQYSGPRITLVNQICDDLLKSRFSTFKKELGAIRAEKKTDEAIWALLRRRKLSPMFFEWVRWLIFNEKENVSLRPRSNTWLAFAVVKHKDRIKDFALTSQEKDDIRETFRGLLKLSPRQHIPLRYKKAFSELESLLAKSRNTNRPLRAQDEIPLNANQKILIGARERPRNSKRKKRSLKLIGEPNRKIKLTS